jgi:hypothetical protein
MRILFGILLIFIGLIGAPIAFMSQITIKSSITAIDGSELSIWLGVLAIIVLLNGFYVLITEN